MLPSTLKPSLRRDLKQDDELALFNEIQMKETDDFLLHSNDDFDDSMSKMRHVCYKHGIKNSICHEIKDLLNAENGKNDYDWLLTPPDSPLFSSLDADVPLPTNCAPRGMADKIQSRNTISSEHHGLSLSPQHGRSIIHSRGLTSSAPRSNSASVLHSSTPSTITSSRRSSTPPKKSSTSTSSSISLTSQLQEWQLYFPGFSSDAPPNLRTSLFDKSTSSYSRRSTSASRNGKQSYSKSRRQPISPKASSGVSSARNDDRDYFSPNNKGSVASFGDNNAQSLRSMTVGITAKKDGVFVNNQTTGFSKNTSRTPPSSSRSINMEHRKTDHRKNPQNMFRPLMSSAPPSYIFHGKAANTMHHSIFSRKSSLKKIEVEPGNCMLEAAPATLSEPSYVADHSVVDSDERISICTICVKSFQTAEAGRGDKVVCQECALKDDLSTATMIENASLCAQMDGTDHLKTVDAKLGMLEFSEETCYNTGLVIQPAKTVVLSQGGSQDNVISQLKMARKEINVDKKFKHSTSFNPGSYLRRCKNVSDGSLKRSRSSKGFVSTTASRPCGKPSSARDNPPNTIKLNYSQRSFPYTSFDQLNAKKSNSMSSSASSFLDLGSSRQMKPHAQSQLRSWKDGMDSLRNYSRLKPTKSSLLSSGGHIRTPKTQIDNHEESPSTVESSQGQKSTRTLTLDEATETLLICSSIIHELVHKAATIGLEKGQQQTHIPELLSPTIPILQRPGLNLKTIRHNPTFKRYFRKNKGVLVGRRKSPNIDPSKCSCTVM